MNSATRIYYLIGTSILLIVANAIFFLHQSSINNESYRSVKKTYETLEVTNLLLASLKDAETGQQGYMITGDSSYLKPYLQVKKRINLLYKRFYSLIKAHTSQQSSLDSLSRLINVKLADLQETIKLKQNGEDIRAYLKIRSNVGKETMDDISHLIDDINNNEKKILQAQDSSIEKLNSRIQVILVFSNLILLIIVVSSLLSIIRNGEKINTLFRQLDHKNELLEKQKYELQQLSHDLIERNGELERFAYVASHDLRSPAANLISLFTLHDYAADDKEKTDLIKIMHEVTENLMKKLNNLVDVLKRKDDTHKYMENLHFQEVYDSVVKNLSGDIRQTKARMIYDFSEAPEILLPKTYLESIMQNLISNALKYRHPDREPEIIVKTSLIKDKTCLKITDNGVGIDLQKHGPDIFGLYKTFHSGRDSKGVGLYITKAQVLAMNGSIEVDSKPDVGTTFTVCF